MSIKLYFRKSLQAKFTLIILGATMLILAGLGAVVFFNRVYTYTNETDNRIKSQLDDFYSLAELNYTIQKDNMESALLLASSLINKSVNSSKDEHDEPLLNIQNALNTISTCARANAYYYQEDLSGYSLLASSNNGFAEKKQFSQSGISLKTRASILNGEVYITLEYENNKRKVSAYKAITVGGGRMGIVKLSTDDSNFIAFQEFVNKKKYYDTGIPYAIDSRGVIELQPTIKNEKLITPELFREIKIKKEGKFILTDKLAATKHWIYFKYFQPLDLYLIIKVNEAEFLGKPLAASRKVTLISLCLAIIIFIIVTRFLVNTITNPVSKLKDTLMGLAKGNIKEKLYIKRIDEIGSIADSMNSLVDSLNKTTQFAQEIGNNNLEAEYALLSNKDVMGQALLTMCENLRAAKNNEKIRKAEEDRRSWATSGHAFFGEILRKDNDDISKFSYNVIINLVNYLKINQGGFFILNDDDKNDVYLELAACFAFDRKKFLTKKIIPGEGLVGTCYLEKKSIFLIDIPKSYIHITSGLGNENPNCILIVPLILNNVVYGIIELASFKKLDKFEIEFVEEIAESIASTISSVKINSRTAQLLEQSQQQAEEMRAQEEEMRQNLEEMQATQEEMQRQKLELDAYMNSVNSTFGMVEFDMDGNYIKINKKFEEITEMSESEILYKHNGFFMSDEKQNSDKFKMLWQYIREGKTQSGGHQYFFNGNEKWFFESFTPLKDNFGNYYKVVAIIDDISKVKKEQDNLKMKYDELVKKLT